MYLCYDRDCTVSFYHPSLWWLICVQIVAQLNCVTHTHTYTHTHTHVCTHTHMYTHTHVPGDHQSHQRVEPRDCPPLIASHETCHGGSNVSAQTCIISYTACIIQRIHRCTIYRRRRLLIFAASNVCSCDEALGCTYRCLPKK